MKKKNIRFDSLFLLILLFGLTNCNNFKKDLKIEKKEPEKFSIETYAYDKLQYPKTNISVPDSLRNQFIENFFVPWNTSSEALLSNLDVFPGKEITYLEKYLRDDTWYGENKTPHKIKQRQKVVTNADLEGFPNFLQKGMVISHTDLRRVPTNRPGFDTYSKAGEGYPFDYFQETGLWANTPLLLAHISKDKQWCYVISPYYKGWVVMHDVALVNEEFIATWKQGSYCMPLSDVLSLTNEASHYALNAKMGMVLPYEELADGSNRVLAYFASADENQYTKLLKTEIDKNAVALETFEFDETNLKSLVSQLVGRPYGWGGYLGNRDCSSMIRDLLATYKIWLPRDSKDQIEVGQQYELKGSTEEKLQLIKENGIPFLTILRKKGHNMLYVGNNPEGEPLILHAIWGLKTSYTDTQLGDFLDTYPIEGIHKDKNDILKGRYIIGETVITTVNIGSENHGITNSLLDDIYIMTNILER